MVAADWKQYNHRNGSSEPRASDSSVCDSMQTVKQGAMASMAPQVLDSMRFVKMTLECSSSTTIPTVFQEYTVAPPTTAAVDGIQYHN